ncbi:MAG TPA: FeoA family protein [Phycisphaerae bacterium]
MSTAFETATRTIHLPTEQAAEVALPARQAARKGLRLTDLQGGETVRILRVNMAESGCRKRFAELGLAEGMKVTVASTGETMMLIIGGSRMGLSSRCACEIYVSRISK